MSAARAPVVAVVQARMGSTRLPGKALAILGHETVLGWVLRRLARAARLDAVVVATSVDAADDAIEAAGTGHGVGVVRGSRDDVLDRFRAAAAATGAGTVVRITADCPLLDPAVVEATVATLSDAGADYVSTNLGGTVVHGIDCEAISRAALDAAAAEATEAAEREHVTPFLYRRPNRFLCAAVPLPEWAMRADVRLTLDEPADLDLLRAVVRRLGAGPETLTTRDAVALVTSEPELAAHAAGVQHRHLPVLRAVIPGDSDLVLSWRNDPDTVRSSRSSRAVTVDQHQRWLAARLADPTRSLWIAEVQGEPVGHIRVDNVDGTPTVSLVVAPAHRGRGYATAMLGALVARHPTGPLEAVVHRDNAASLAAFRRTGFTEVGDDGPWIVLRRR